LVYDNSDYEAYYYPEFVKLFYVNLDQDTIKLTPTNSRYT